MSQRVSFVADWASGAWSMTDLCARYGVSRQTGYERIRRWEHEGPASLVDRSRAPHHPGRAVAPDQRDAIYAVRRRYPHWGPRKLRAWLQDHEPDRRWPAASTMGDLLRRAGLSEPHRRRRYVPPLTQPYTPVTAANDLWSADFKGWYRTVAHVRCDPLTVIDSATRFALACQIVAPRDTSVRPRFERLFHEYGLPRAIRTDNGAPFGSGGLARLTHLSVWWLRLGIRVEHITPGHPEENARHERFHRTLADETVAVHAATPAALQRHFDRVRQEFNDERPHEALGQQPPARLYTPSGRRYRPHLEDPWYPPTMQVRRVRGRGELKWEGDLLYLSEALCGQWVGLLENDVGNWQVYFLAIELGTIDRDTHAFRPTWQAGVLNPRRPGEGVRP